MPALLVGREEECRTITETVTASPPVGLVIAGPPGVGRTRLAEEARTIAEEQGRTTRWASATSATSELALGALAHLLPPMDGLVAPLSLLQRAARELSDGASGHPPLLVVDDVHLLDHLSLTLLHQLAASRTVTLVLTVRADRATSDPVAALWKDGLATRVELGPLDRSRAEELARELVHGQLESRTADKLWRLSEGNPLFLRELIEDGRRAGQLRDHRGVWRWPQRITPSQRLAEIVLAQLGTLTPTESAVLEVLAAAGEPLHVDRVVELSSAEGVAALVRRGIVVDDDPGRSPAVRAAHPLYTAVARQRASRAVLRDVRLTEGQPLPTSPHRLRHVGELLLDRAAAEGAAPGLTEAAHQANRLFDHDLAQQLAAAAVDAGGGMSAQVALAEAVHWQGRAAHAEQVARVAELLPGSPADQVALAVTRAVGLCCGLARPGDAVEVLRAVADAGGDADDRSLLAATEAYLAFLGGSPRRAVELGTGMPVAGRQGVAVPLAAAAVASGLAVAGQCAGALAAVRTGWGNWRRVPAGPLTGFVHLALAQAEMLALLASGRIQEMEHRAAQLQEQNLAGPEWAGDAVLALHRGSAALAAGRSAVAVRWLTEALAGLEAADPMGVRALCVAELATAEVLAGHGEQAHALVAGGAGAMGRLPAALRPEAMVVEAWLAAADGLTSAAGGLAMDVAAEAARTGQPVVEALMLHTAARFGLAGDVQPRITTLAAEVDSPLVSACADHVTAVVSRSGPALAEVGARFHAMGAVLLAADAAADAAAAYEQAGDLSAAARSRSTAASLSRSCGLGPAPSPVNPASSPLTPREAEMAEQAARGATNQEIAARLVVSVRTVETHLRHVYAKLGITGRRDLADALGVSPEAAQEPSAQS